METPERQYWRLAGSAQVTVAIKKPEESGDNPLISVKTVFGGFCQVKPKNWHSVALKFIFLENRVLPNLILIFLHYISEC